ncbi:MAG TPA: thiamine pyrophosphate-binding protein, partial [Acidimicrobiia bacterium]|nr:thiamine pyrophosphate-binding protein [Acidimicrobiia bacterium]
MLLGTVLARLGVRHVFGDELPGCEDTQVRDAEAARLLAEADGAVGSGLGAHLNGSTLTLVSRPGVALEPAHARCVADVVDAIADARARGAGAIAITLDFDAAGSGGKVTLPAARDPSLAPSLPGRELALGAAPATFDLVLAGSGVIRAGAVDALRTLAEETGLGVLNVFTAKGLFRWDSPFHLGTAGLQLHDFALA